MAKYALVVEDNNQVCLLVTHILELLGFIVLKADTEEDAWKLYLQYQSDISYIFTDYALRAGNGFNLYKKVRQYNKYVTVIISSGLPDFEVTEIDNDPHGSYLAKPFGVDQLMRTAECSLPNEFKLMPQAV